MTYAKGKYALGECAKSGKILPLHDLVEDGQFPGLMVAPEWYEPKHPLEDIKSVTDPVALRNPSPRQDSINAYVDFPRYDVLSGQGGTDLFTIIGCLAAPINETTLYVALYASEPGATYSSQGESSGYPQGGVPVATALDGDVLTLATTTIIGTNTETLWLLVYDHGTGQGLFKTNLGSLAATIRGTFTVDWACMNFVLKGEHKCIDYIRTCGADAIKPAPPEPPAPVTSATFWIVSQDTINQCDVDQGVVGSHAIAGTGAPGAADVGSDGTLAVYTKPVVPDQVGEFDTGDTGVSPSFADYDGSRYAYMASSYSSQNIYKMDIVSRSVAASADIGGSVFALACGGGWLCAARNNGTGHEVNVVNQSTLAITNTVALPYDYPQGMSHMSGSLFALIENDIAANQGVLFTFDASTLALTEIARLPEYCDCIAFDAGKNTAYVGQSSMYAVDIASKSVTTIAIGTTDFAAASVYGRTMFVGGNMPGGGGGVQAFDLDTGAIGPVIAVDYGGVRAIAYDGGDLLEVCVSSTSWIHLVSLSQSSQVATVSAQQNPICAFYEAPYFYWIEGDYRGAVKILEKNNFPSKLYIAQPVGSIAEVQIADDFDGFEGVDEKSKTVLYGTTAVEHVAVSYDGAIVRANALPAGAVVHTYAEGVVALETDVGVPAVYDIATGAEIARYAWTTPTDIGLLLGITAYNGKFYWLLNYSNDDKAKIAITDVSGAQEALIDVGAALVGSYGPNMGAGKAGLFVNHGDLSFGPIRIDSQNIYLADGQYVRQAVSGQVLLPVTGSAYTLAAWSKYNPSQSVALSGIRPDLSHSDYARPSNRSIPISMLYNGAPVVADIAAGIALYQIEGGDLKQVFSDPAVDDLMADALILGFTRTVDAEPVLML